MECENCRSPIEKELSFTALDNKMPVGARQRYLVKKKLCPACGEIFKAQMRQQNQIYLINKECY